MLRGPNRYQYVEATSEYHQIANPIISPIKGAKMRLPKSMVQSRELAVQCGPLLRHLHPVVPDNGWYNTVAAFRKRCNYFNAGRAEPAIVAASIKLVDIICPRPLDKFEWTDSLYQSWLSKFGTEKRQRMDKSLGQLCEAQLNDYTGKEIFVKVEALLVAHKPNWAPRVIFKGSDVYNAISGPIFNELMRRFDHCLERMEGPYRFHSSYRKTPTEYVPFIERKDASHQFWLEADFSSNDKFQCSDVQVLEMALMRVLGCPEWFVRLHAKTNDFGVRNAKHGIKAKLQNQLPTGATDTTFRNTWWNACILYSFLERTKPVSCDAVLLGDDMLARITGKVPYAEKTYTSIAAEAMMEAKVIRHKALWTATFLSRFFVPHQDCQHLTVPILGKALGRFNMRANKNQAVSNNLYMACKSVGYAYEFRYLPCVRDIFLKRFKHEFPLAVAKNLKGDYDVEVSWNAKQAGVTLRNITKKIQVSEVLCEYDFNAFCIERYSLTANDVLDLFEQVVLSTEIVDIEGVVVQKLARDFL
jgi:hypothetical protein